VRNALLYPLRSKEPETSSSPALIASFCLLPFELDSFLVATLSSGFLGATIDLIELSKDG